MSERESMPYDVVIVGGGPAGNTAATYAARLGPSVTHGVDRAAVLGELGLERRRAGYGFIVLAGVLAVAQERVG